MSGVVWTDRHQHPHSQLCARAHLYTHPDTISTSTNPCLFLHTLSAMSHRCVVMEVDGVLDLPQRE